MVVSRREFVRFAGGAAAALSIVPRRVLGGRGITAPSDRLNIAGIGVGNQGLRDIQSVASENIVALCDVDQSYAAKAFAEFPAAKRHVDFRRMLETQKEIDAVVVGTPDHIHAPVCMMAIQAGKHVYCEKPLTHSVWEARILTEAARKTGVATQMGNQGHSGDGARLINEWIWDGAIGDVREVHCWTDRPIGTWPTGVNRPKESMPVPATLDWDLWLGPAPFRPYHGTYLPKIWRGWWDFGCGALGDMGCHLIDHPFWALKLGHPSTIEASSSRLTTETIPAASIIHYEFPRRGEMPPVRLTWYDGGLRPPRPEELEPEEALGAQGILFVGEKGKLMADCYGRNPRLIPLSRMQEYRQPAPSIPRSKGHAEDWILACKGGSPASSNFDYAGPLSEMVLLGNVALRARQKLEWDGEKLEVTNHSEANQFIRREYRKGWSL